MKAFYLLITLFIPFLTFAQWTGSTTLTGSINRQGKVILNSTGWDQHLEISRTGFGGTFVPDNSLGYYGLRLELVGTGSNFYVMNGNVGIGTTSPSSRLSVVGSGSSNIDLIVNGRIASGDDDDNGGMWVNNVQTMLVGQNTSSSLGFYNNGAWRMIVDNTGQVGIGTTNPFSKLHVTDSRTN